MSQPFPFFFHSPATCYHCISPQAWYHSRSPTPRNPNMLKTRVRTSIQPSSLSGGTESPIRLRFKMYFVFISHPRQPTLTTALLSSMSYLPYPTCLGKNHTISMGLCSKTRTRFIPKNLLGPGLPCVPADPVTGCPSSGPLARDVASNTPCSLDPFKHCPPLLLSLCPLLFFSCPSNQISRPLGSVLPTCHSVPASARNQSRSIRCRLISCHTGQ